jgi:RNA polymerase sigma-70 factor, ECF subfamily
VSAPAKHSCSSDAVDSVSQRFLQYVATRDVQLLDTILAEHLTRAYSQARHMMSSGPEAEDVVQEAFILVCRFADRFDGSIPFKAWLARIVHNAALNAIRARGRRRRHEDRARSQANAQSAPEQTTDEELIRAAVRELPEVYRAGVDLHYFAGLSVRETAQALGLKENALAMRLLRARECLRSLLQRRGVAVTGVAIMAVLAETPTYAAPATFALSAPAIISGAATSTSASLPGIAITTGIGAMKAALAAAFILPLSIGSAYVMLSRPAPASTFSWNFDDGKCPEQLRAQLGDPLWIADGGPAASGAFESGNGFTLNFNITGDFPVRVSFDDYIQPDSDHFGTHVNFNWDSERDFVLISNAVKPGHAPIGNIPRWYRRSFFICDRFVVEETGNENGPGFLCSVRRESSNSFRLTTVGGHRIDNLVCERAEDQDMSYLQPYLTAAEKMQPDYRRTQGIYVYLPDLPSTDPIKPAMACFYHAEQR